MSAFITLIGNLTKDPLLNNTQSGDVYTKFNLAVDRYGQKDKVDYFQVTAWKTIAENICKFTEKGSLVAITGTIHTKFETKEDGTKSYTTEVQVHNVKFLSKSKGGN